MVSLQNGGFNQITILFLFFPHLSEWLLLVFGPLTKWVECPGDRGSIPGQVIPKTQKMVLDAALLNTQYYKVRVKWSNSGKGVAPPFHLGVVAIEKGAFGSPSTKCANFIYYWCHLSWQVRGSYYYYYYFVHFNRSSLGTHTPVYLGILYFWGVHHISFCSPQNFFFNFILLFTARGTFFAEINL